MRRLIQFLLFVLSLIAFQAPVQASLNLDAVLGSCMLIAAAESGDKKDDGKQEEEEEPDCD